MSIGWLKDHRRAIPRRAFLAGAGTAVSLPIFESLLSREGRAAAAADPIRRLITYYVGNGHNMATWRPTGMGKDYVLSENLKPLANLKADFTVISGLNNAPGVPDALGDHAAGTSAAFTATHAFKSTMTLKLAKSVDQLASDAKGKLTPVQSVQLGMENGTLIGGCDSGYACAYSNSISWSGEATAMAKITTHQAAFDLLFSGGAGMGVDPAAATAAALKRKAYRQSVLDFVIKDTGSLSGKLGRADKGKLDEYLTGVREVERSVQSVTTAPPAMCKAMAAPAVAATDWGKIAQVWADIMVLAMQCDVTRIFSFMFSNAVTGRVYKDQGATKGHHAISHHGNDPANLATLTKISTFEVEQLNYLLTKMKAVPEGDGKDVLYNSVLVYSSDVSDGNRHNHDDMPVLVAGHGGGMLSTGQHIVYAPEAKTRYGDMLTTALRTLGVMDKVGDGVAPLPEMLAV